MGFGAGSLGLGQFRPTGDNQQKAAQFYQMARSGMSPPPAEQQKTTSGALMSGMGGAMAGAQLAPLVGMTGPVGAGVVGALALGSYLFS